MPNSSTPGPESQDHDEGFEDLPGLEPDEPPSDPEPQQPDPTPQSEASSPPAGDAPARYGDGQWTNDELDDWYENEFGGDKRYNEVQDWLRWRRLGRGGGPDQSPLAATLEWMNEEYEWLEETELDDHLPDDQRSPEARLSEAFLSREAEFRNLGPRLKATFRDGIQSHDPRPNSADPDQPTGSTGPPDEQAPTSLYRVDITMPDGTVATVERDRSTSTQRRIDSDGNVGEWQDIEQIPDDQLPPQTDDAPAIEPGTKISTIGGLPRNLVLGGGAVIVVVLAVVFTFVGGGSSSGPWSATDPLNDFAPSFSGGEPIENPSSAGDVTHLLVEIADGNTTVTVTFAGNAEQLLVEGGEELSAALQFIPAGDERFIDMLLSEDGSSKISDPPSGASISHSWTSSNVLVFQITGLTPASGATVRFATIQRLGFGHSTDEVSLSTGAAGSAPATAEPTVVDSSGGVPDAPLVIQPCSVIDVETAELLGSVVLADQGGNSRKLDCRYIAEAAGITLDMLVQRNSAPRSGVFKSFRSVNEDAIEVRTLPWSEDSELRVSEFGTNRSRASVLAYVITSDPVGRDVYLWITVVGPPGDGTALGALIETFAELLRDAIIEAQP